MMNAMVLCALMLAAILKNGKTYVSEEEEAYFMFECRKCVSAFTSAAKTFR
jgi:calcium release-activated calcium channel protein 1